MGAFDIIGQGIATGLDVLLNRPGSPPSAMPRKSILSGRVNLLFQTPDGEDIYVAEFDEMSKQKVFGEKKKFKPFGSTKVIVLKEDNGWDLTLSGHKTDTSLDKLVYIQEKYLSGTGVASKPTTESTFNAEEFLGVGPLFSITESTKNNNGEFIIYTYKDVSIVDYVETVPPDNNPVIYTLKLFSPTRDLAKDSVAAESIELETVLSKIILEVVVRNMQ